MPEKELVKDFVNNFLIAEKEGAPGSLGMSGLVPSFCLEGKPSKEFIGTWKKEVKSKRSDDKILHTIKWIKPDNSFEARCEATEFLNHPAIEWKLYFKNTGKKNSPQIQDITPLDATIKSSKKHWQSRLSLIELHYNRGSDCTMHDFEPITELFNHGHSLLLNCCDGRTSDQYLPFWNLDCAGWGVVCALGWSGSWKAKFRHDLHSKQFIMRAGMDNIDLYLKPGEEINVPTICLLFWEGNEYIKGNNLFRRFMRDICMPKWNNKDPITLAMMGGSIALETVNENNQIEFIRNISVCGAEIYWLDAGWYQAGPSPAWYACRGNWFPDKNKFPNGLKPLRNEAHKLGMKFLLWFDPETVNPSTAISNEHPEWIIRNNENETGLFNLGIPEARKYITDLISSLIKECGVGIYRNDFNIEPGPYWQMADEPQRKGITEIRYVEGLYKFWDELRKRHPNLLIDNCASGGRRIDYETCKRSVPMWRSDAQCSPTDPLINIESQNQTYGLSYYLPVHSAGVTIIGSAGSSISENKKNPLANFDKYKIRSGTTCSVVLCVGQESFDKPVPLPLEKFQEIFSEIRKYNYLFLEDYYPLTEFSLSEGSWMAFQFDSPEKGEGFALFFRRAKAPYKEAEFQLKAFDDESRYKMTFIDTGKKITATGKEIRKVNIKLEPGTSALVLYKKEK